METTIVFTPAQLMAFIGAVCGFIASIGAAVAIIAKFITKIKAPEQEQNRRIKTLEEEVKELKSRLDSGNDKFAELDRSNKVILRSLSALLAQSLGADATEALKEAKRELDQYLIEK